MATTVNEQQDIILLDGSELSVRPLKISLLREFMKKFQSIADVAEDNEKSMNVLMDCVQIAMKQYKPELAEDIKALEDTLDLPTVYKIVEIASGNSALFNNLNR
jgi:inhibitor of KinA sporulation pathway (predicted exonuclease)